MMNHFTTEEWIDYANEVLAEPKKVQLRKHLDDGCRSCLRMAAMWGGVRRDVPVMVSNRRGKVIHAVTNQFGEFRGEIENSGDLELSFPGPKDKQVLISLRDALGKLHGGPR